MKNVRKHSKISTIALILTLTIAATLVTITPVVALKSANILVFASPDPVGINQEMRIGGWITPLPSYRPPNFVYWDGVLIEITKPDGTTDILGPIRCDSAANFYRVYTPVQQGTYSVKASWNGDGSDAAQAFTYSPVSRTTQFTVQQEPILPWSSEPVPGPDQYWERPISAEYREWNVLAGSWIYSNGPARGGYNASVAGYQPYSRAPNTAHINWVIQAAQGGLIGGESMGDKFTENTDMIILGGLGYYADGWTVLPHTAGYTYNTAGVGPTDLSTFTLHCVDIRTGEELWAKPTYSYGLFPTGGTGRIGSMLQGAIEPIPQLMSSGGSGPKAYLLSIRSTFVRWDAFTGTQMFLMNNSLTGLFDGQFVYSRVGSNLIKWDALALSNLNPTIESVTVYNVTAPSVTFGESTSYLSPSMTSGGVGIATYSVPYEDDSLTAPGIAGIDLETGERMWNRTLFGYEGGQYTACTGLGQYFVKDGDTTAWHGFDIYTGEEVWTSEPGVLPWSLFGSYASACAYDTFYGFDYDGYIYAIDVDSGDTVWKYYSGDSGLETGYGHWPQFSPPAVADGKLYSATSEHSPDNPPWRGGKLTCLNAYSGDVIWQMPWLGGWKAVADGMLIAQNEYDNRIYGFGKGLTATTVSASPKIIADGASVLIEGTVMDQSPGAPDSPAIADEDMSEWMQYLYMNKPMPADAKGVTVHLTSIDPNGNFQDIGYATTDLNGNFGKMWQPPVPGEYKIIATFEGSESYWTSDATTYFGVTEAPSLAQPIEPEPTEATEAPFITTEVTIIAAVAVIAVVGIVAFWALRRRK